MTSAESNKVDDKLDDTSNSPEAVRALLQDYQIARDDDRAAQSVLSALFGVSVTLLGALIAALAGDYPLPREAFAIAPLAPLSTIAYAILVGSNTTMRGFYLRALEEELRTRLFANANLAILDGVKPMSCHEFIVGSSSGVRGRRSLRIVYVLIAGSVLVIFGGVTVLIGYRIGGIYAFLMFVIYTPLSLILFTEGVTLGVAGRSIFQTEINRFRGDNYASIRSLRDLKSTEIDQRSLRSYLLFPRPGELIKWTLVPAAATVGLLLPEVFRHLSSRDLWALLIGWLAFEYLVYQARYQINDVRGLTQDLDHPESRARMRLPVHGHGIRASVKASLIAVVVRLVILVSILILNPLDVRERLGIAALATFLIAIPYEYLRTREFDNPSAGRRLTIQIWVIVGSGYAIRVFLGMSLVGINSVAVLVIFAASAWLFGIMFVTMIWALEATSYLVKSESGRYYYLGNHDSGQSKDMPESVQPAPSTTELAGKAHLLHLLPFVKVHVAGKRARTRGDTDCSRTKYLESGPTLLNPWNIGLLGAVLLSVIACNLTPPSPGFNAGDVGVLIVVTIGFLVLSIMKSTRARLGVLAATLVSILGLATALSVNHRWPALFSLLIFGMVYIFFSGSSYHDIITFNVKVAEQVSLAKRAALRLLVGGATFYRMFSQEQAAPNQQKRPIAKI